MCAACKASELQTLHALVERLKTEREYLAACLHGVMLQDGIVEKLIAGPVLSGGAEGYQPGTGAEGVATGHAALHFPTTEMSSNPISGPKQHT